MAADDAHVEPTLAAIAHGKHVVCEKPLASSASEALRLYQAAKAAGVKHLVCFNYRFFPAVRLAWELVHDGTLGDLHQARFRFSQEWRNDPSATLPTATGALGVLGCHAVDQARFLCGEISSVQALLSSPVTTSARLYNGRPIERDDVAAILAETESGLVVTIDASRFARPAEPPCLGAERLSGQRRLELGESRMCSGFTAGTLAAPLALQK